jgi:hypothetical protein
VAGTDARGRVDVIVNTPDDKPLMLLECKAPEVPLGDDALDQALRYHSAIGGSAPIIAITNGLETRWYRASGKDRVERIVHAPGFLEMLAGVLPTALAQRELPPRPDARKVPAATLRWMLAEGILGEGSPVEHYPYLANLAGLLLLERNSPTLRGRPGCFTVEGSGIRSTYFGNAAGGKWIGNYRYFLIKDARGDAQIVSISVLGMMLVRDHPKFGNTSGRTMLIVAVDDFDKRHNSLQLDLDRFVYASEETATLWHDGTLTRGKRGAARRAEVIAYMRQRTPQLVDGTRIRLGTVPVRTPISWEDAEDLIYNVIEYALARDAYRREAG